MSINGDVYDWEDVSITSLTGTIVNIEEISYSDERPVELRYGKGSTPRGYGRKNYKASGSMVLDRNEADLLRLILGGSFYKGTLPIIVKYGSGDKTPRVDIMPEVKITKQETDAKQDSENAGQVKLEFVCVKPIKWNLIDAI